MSTVNQAPWIHAADLLETSCSNVFRATGITTRLEDGGAIKKPPQLDAHESPGTTELCHRPAAEAGRPRFFEARAFSDLRP
jgi:hypothetical protein